MKKIRVLVVDDSALMRELLTKLLNSDPKIEVVGTAMDAFAAREQIKRLDPDVLTLDVEMPKMDGLTFLGNLMRLRPMPVVMVSTLTTRGADMTFRALDLGAVDFVAKPRAHDTDAIERYTSEVNTKVKAAALAAAGTQAIAAKCSPACHPHPAPRTTGLGTSDHQTTDRVIAIGASTGGTEAIKEVLMQMHTDCPGIAIAQHIPPVFSRSFAERMNQLSPLNVCEAKDGQPILPGHAYIAPGDRHLVISRDGENFHCQLLDSEPVNRHKPSVDVLFNSVADHVGKHSIGVILTGMGKDGAKGLRHMRDTGCRTIAQDEKTSVVWGMPGSAVYEDAADNILPLDRIAKKVTDLYRNRAA